jgi:hypothetical protein
LVLLVALAGCGDRLVARKIEAGVKAKLPEIIGPADSYEVSVSGRAARMISGKVSEINIIGNGVRLKGETYVDELVVQMRDVVFDTDKNSLREVGGTTFQASLSEKSLNRLACARQPELDGLKITLGNGMATVQARPGLLGLSANVTLTGRMELGPKNSINFVSERMSVAGIQTPGMVRDFIMRRVNPVMVLPTSGFPATLTRLTVMSKQIKVDGTADLVTGMRTAGKGVE